MSNVFWALHVRGPDSIFAMPDYETAVAFADWFTAVDRVNITDECSPIFAAVPALWPGDAVSHATATKAQADTPASQRELPLNVPRGSISELTEAVRGHPISRLGEIIAREKLS